MAEIRLTTKDDDYPIIYRVSAPSQGGCLGFNRHQQYFPNLKNSPQNKKLGRIILGVSY